MNKKDLIEEMVEKGITSDMAYALLDTYSEIPAITYSTVQSSKTKKKYKIAFGEAYDNFGIYVFYETGTSPKIIYIGEAASEPFRKRLSQHFNKSHGGLRHKKPNSIGILNKSEILVLYGKYNQTQARETHLDEDLLIGTFRPLLNDR